MKHEAFVDAVTMLDDDIIAEAQEPFRRKSRAKVIGFCSAAAACAAVIGAVLLLPGGNGVDILVMGRELSDSPIALSSGNADSERAAISAYSLEPTDIPVSIDAHGLTVVTVYGGEIYQEGLTQPAETPLEITGSSALVWERSAVGRFPGIHPHCADRKSLPYPAAFVRRFLAGMDGQ